MKKEKMDAIIDYRLKRISNWLMLDNLQSAFVGKELALFFGDIVDETVKDLAEELSRGIVNRFKDEGFIGNEDAQKLLEELEHP